MASKEKMQISSISTKSGKSAPIIANFLNGEPQPNLSNKLKCLVKRDSNNVIEKVKVYSDRKMIYTNLESPEDDFRTFIAIRNKTTNKVHLIETDQILLKPLIKEKDVEENQEMTSEIRMSLHKKLNETFGSKKKRIILDRKNKMQINIAHEQDFIDNTASSRTITDMELTFAEDNDPSDYFLECLPPNNREATTPEEVYLLKDIISDEDLENLSEAAERIMKKENNIQQEYQLSPFFNACFNALSGDDKKKKICMLLFAESLLRIVNFTMDNKKHFLPCPFSVTVNKKIYAEFTNKNIGGRLVTHSLKDKAICHLLVILFLTFKFHIDLGWVMTSYKGGLQRLRELMTIVGGTLISKMTNAYVLKVPLPKAPSLKRKRAK